MTNGSGQEFSENLECQPTIFEWFYQLFMALLPIFIILVFLVWFSKKQRKSVENYYESSSNYQKQQTQLMTDLIDRFDRLIVVLGQKERNK
jgi:ATP-dependent Zn protease